MAQSLSSIRSFVAGKVNTLAGFKESRMTPDFFGRTQESIAHKAFVVGIASTVAAEDRQRRSIGEYVNSQVVITFAHRLRPLDAYPTDYDNALTAEELVINAALEAYTFDSGNGKFTIRYQSSNRTVTDSQEYIIINLTFSVLHTL
tara:strand:+ start:159 stop:596 length:438 start_codon:yes stop_codon:yes gene_type:complete